MNEIERMNRMERRIDTAIEEALSTTPLEAAPGGLYLAVMQQVNAQNRLRRPASQASRAAALERAQFRPSWLDLALSLFGAGMLALTGLLWNWLPAPAADYLRMQALYAGLQLVYVNTSLLAWCGIALALLVTGLLAGLLSCMRLGVFGRSLH